MRKFFSFVVILFCGGTASANAVSCFELSQKVAAGDTLCVDFYHLDMETSVSLIFARRFDATDVVPIESLLISGYKKDGLGPEKTVTGFIIDLFHRDTHFPLAIFADPQVLIIKIGPKTLKVKEAFIAATDQIGGVHPVGGPRVVGLLEGLGLVKAHNFDSGGAN